MYVYPQQPSPWLSQHLEFQQLHVQGDRAGPDRHPSGNSAQPLVEPRHRRTQRSRDFHRNCGRVDAGQLFPASAKWQLHSCRRADGRQHPIGQQYPILEHGESGRDAKFRDAKWRGNGAGGHTGFFVPGWCRRTSAAGTYRCVEHRRPAGQSSDQSIHRTRGQSSDRSVYGSASDWRPGGWGAGSDQGGRLGRHDFLDAGGARGNHANHDHDRDRDVAADSVDSTTGCHSYRAVITDRPVSTNL